MRARADSRSRRLAPLNPASAAKNDPTQNVEVISLKKCGYSFRSVKTP